jgi:hypothetical protein
MTMKLTACSLATAAALLCTSSLASAQTVAPTSPHVPLHKTIGRAAPAIVPSLIVLHARGASLQGGKLTLTGPAPTSIIFADRPVRAAGHAPTVHVLEEWAPGNDDAHSFAKDPPNAIVSAFSKDDAAIRDVVVVLKTPKLEGDRLTFDVEVIDGDLTGADGAAAVFIDPTPVAFDQVYSALSANLGRTGGVDRGGVAGGSFARRDFARVDVGRAGYVRRGAWYRRAD